MRISKNSSLAVDCCAKAGAIVERTAKMARDGLRRTVRFSMGALTVTVSEKRRGVKGEILDEGKAKAGEYLESTNNNSERWEKLVVFGVFGGEYFPTGAV